MRGVIEKNLIVTKNEQEVITKLIEILEDFFKLDFDNQPQDLIDIMYAISAKDDKVLLPEEIIKIEYN